jgi:ABC-type nitrate/sulfonate/bicarbonate transport system, permease component
MLAWGTTLSLLALWEVLARAGVLSSEIPPFTTVIDWLSGRVTTGAFWASVRETMWHWAAGLAVGVVAGVVIGALTGAVPVLYRLLQLPLEFLRPIPSIVYLPILILVLGATSKTAIICTAIAATWPMLFQTFYGVRAVDPLTVETGRMFGFDAAPALGVDHVSERRPVHGNGPPHIGIGGNRRRDLDRAHRRCSRSRG